MSKKQKITKFFQPLNVRQTSASSADAVDNGNNDSKTASTSEVPMEVEGKFV